MENISDVDEDDFLRSACSSSSNSYHKCVCGPAQQASYLLWNVVSNYHIVKKPTQDKQIN